MNRRTLWGIVTVALMVAWTLPADAGRRHRSCRTCSTTGSGTWFHFTSGGGTYVPFASTTTAGRGTDYPTYPSSHSGMVYGASYSAPPHYSSPSACYHCR